MAKRFLTVLCALLLLAVPALAEVTVDRMEGEAFFPNEKNWVYHFIYAYPRLTGDDYTTALINDTYEMALDEMVQLVLPMFANSPDMRYDGKNEISHNFSVTCNDGKLLSILQTKAQTRGGEGPILTLEPLTFDVSGMYAGESLTLRGVTLILGGADPEKLEELAPEDVPALAHIIDGSSTEMAEALMPRLYAEFQSLQADGIIQGQWTYEDFEDECSPANNFYADENGNLVFFFPPMMLKSPSFDVPLFSFTPEELDGILASLWE